MKISTRTRYGMRAAMELACEFGKGPLQVKVIAARQGISTKYLEQLVSTLKSAGIVRSVRGPKGGYVLAKEPKEVKLSEIFRVLEGASAAVDCIDNPDVCPKCDNCSTRQIWSAITETLESQTLQDLVDIAKSQGKTDDYQI